MKIDKTVSNIKLEEHMKNKPWNHNYAYHNWIQKKLKNKKKVLDVGCGNGTLAFQIAEQGKLVTGLDCSHESIKSASQKNSYKTIQWVEDDFLNHDFKNEKFDAIVFVASIHHMNMKDAIEKAKSILEKNGVIIIVGLSKPSNILDWIIEILRILPSKLISAWKKSKPSEELNLTVSYKIPKMKEIRKICNKELKNNKIKYGLHYRYLLYWQSKQS